MEIEYIKTVSSTNDHILVCDRDMALVYSDFQTKGRGQRGNGWESETGMNLTFSFMLKPNELKASSQFVISKMVALALVNTLHLYDIEAKIKWPNDIYVEDKKISGILIENVLSSNGMLSKVVCGIGLNVNQVQFLSDAPNPVSMAMSTGKNHSREQVLSDFCDEFEKLYVGYDFQNSKSVDFSYWEELYRRDAYHKYIDAEGEFIGKIIAIGQYGELIVERKSDGLIKSYLFKDMKYLW